MCRLEPQLVEEINLLHDHVCKGLSDPKRIMILYALRQKACYVSEMAGDLKMPQPTVSRHLKVLRDCGLVTTSRDGAAVFYEIADMRIIEALDLMRALLHDQIMDQARVVTVTNDSSNTEG